jgi:hypothetical protein
VTAHICEKVEPASAGFIFVVHRSRDAVAARKSPDNLNRALCDGYLPSFQLTVRMRIGQFRK